MGQCMEIEFGSLANMAVLNLCVHGVNELPFDFNFRCPFC